MPLYQSLTIVPGFLDTLFCCNRDDVEFWLKVFGVVGALVALVLTWRTHSERATFDMIDRMYSLCHVLETHALADWHLAHIFCINKKGSENEYEVFRERIRSEAARDNAKLAELMVKEKLFAIHVFIIYEQVYYQWKYTSRFFHRRRRRFLEEMLRYFTDRLLQNPRLVAFLDDDPDGRSLHMETESRNYLASKIGGKPMDKDGPFV